MRTPPWLTGLALLFWGWQTGLLLWGALLAAVLEGARFTRTRWELSNTDLNRISDLCAALVVAAALLLYSAEDRLMFIFKLAQWLPFCFFPIILAQAYGNRPKMPLSVFWWLLRRSPASPAAGKSYNISFCYFAFCLLAASASTQEHNGATRTNGFFYPGMALLVALALTSGRPRRVSLSAWVTLLLLVATAGQFGHQGLQRMQSAVETALGAWIAHFLPQSQDARECPTQIGIPGPISQSGKIALRVRPEPGGYAPALLREAVWDAYKKGTWSASNNDFSDVQITRSDTVKLLPTNMYSSEVEIARYYPSGTGTLALPHGTFELNDVLAAVVQTNRLGVAKIENGPGLLDIQAFFGPGRSFDSPPCERDLIVQADETNTLAQVVAEMKLEGMTDRQKIRAIERFFATNFKYSLNPPRHQDRTSKVSWLGYFLTQSHAGHCEYFASATVLLLRQAGINARYVTGYAVPESARHGDTYIVRERHAHAWALVYHSDTGLWEQIDTTPSGWDKAMAAQPPWWESISDSLSNLYFQFSKWRWSKTSYARYSMWLLVPMILYLIGRILLSQHRQRQDSGTDDAGRRPAWPGLDSELYLINQKLVETQLSRQPNEPLRSWQQRLELAFPESDRLRRIFLLHRGLRFDPHGLKEDDRQTLRSEAQRWLAEFTARTRGQKQTAPSRAPG